MEDALRTTSLRQDIVGDIMHLFGFDRLRQAASGNALFEINVLVSTVAAGHVRCITVLGLDRK
jgi:hypothetical protein